MGVYKQQTSSLESLSSHFRTHSKHGARTGTRPTSNVIDVCFAWHVDLCTLIHIRKNRVHVVFFVVSSELVESMEGVSTGRHYFPFLNLSQ